MPNLSDVVAAYRAQLLAREAQAAARLVRAYGTAYKRIQADLGRITKRIEAAREAGEPLGMSWLFQQQRLHALKDQADAEMRVYSEVAETTITAAQEDAVAMGLRHSVGLMDSALPEAPPGASVSWTRLPKEGMADLVGRMSDGSPLRKTLDSLGKEPGQALENALIQGLATGQNPKTLAASVRTELGANLTRGLTISRTEILRTYRETSRRSFAANSEKLEGWWWSATLDPSTCPSCWAMSGTVHTADETMDSHPNCRCAMVPRTLSWEELGFEGIPDTRPKVESGIDAFAKAPESVQRAVLGPAAFEAWKAGAVKLEDFVGQKHSDAWGTMRYTRSLKAAQEAHDSGKGKAGMMARGYAGTRRREVGENQ